MRWKVGRDLEHSTRPVEGQHRTNQWWSEFAVLEFSQAEETMTAGAELSSREEIGSDWCCYARISQVQGCREATRLGTTRTRTKSRRSAAVAVTSASTLGKWWLAELQHAAVQQEDALATVFELRSWPYKSERTRTTLQQQEKKQRPVTKQSKGKST